MHCDLTATPEPVSAVVEPQAKIAKSKAIGFIFDIPNRKKMAINMGQTTSSTDKKEQANRRTHTVVRTSTPYQKPTALDSPLRVSHRAPFFTLPAE